MIDQCQFFHSDLDVRSFDKLNAGIFLSHECQYELLLYLKKKFNLKFLPILKNDKRLDSPKHNYIPFSQLITGTHNMLHFHTGELFFSKPGYEIYETLENEV